MSNKENALNAFLQKKAEINRAINRLQLLSDDHFNVDPDKINWADVGDLTQCAKLLKVATDFIFNEEE